jgi:hypothetical protein
MQAGRGWRWGEGEACPDALTRSPRPGRMCQRPPPRRTRGALGGGDRHSALEGLTIRVGACWALADDDAPGHPASVAPPILRLGHLAAPETGRRRETPAHMHRAGLDGRLLSSGSVWWRGDVDEDRRCAWLSVNALSAKSGPCGGRSRATTGAICASGVITRPGLRTSTPSAQHGGSCPSSVRVNTRGLPDDCHKGKKV